MNPVMSKIEISGLPGVENEPDRLVVRHSISIDPITFTPPVYMKIPQHVQGRTSIVFVLSDLPPAAVLPILPRVFLQLLVIVFKLLDIVRRLEHIVPGMTVFLG